MERYIVYPMRNNEMERVWEYEINTNGFKHYWYCRGTDTEVQEYIKTEFPEAYERAWRHACSEKVVEMLGELHIKIYIAPQISKR